MVMGPPCLNFGSWRSGPRDLEKTVASHQESIGSFRTDLLSIYCLLFFLTTGLGVAKGHNGPLTEFIF